MYSSDAYATFVVGFAITMDSLIYTLVLPFLPDLFAKRLHVPGDEISRWTALSFEVFAVTALLSNAVVGFFTQRSASKSRPFLLSILIMLASTVLFFLAPAPWVVLVARAFQGASAIFTWVFGLAFLAAQVEESRLGEYVGWTTVGVAIGEVVGPLVGGPIYDLGGQWAIFAIVESLLVIDILLRLFVREKKPARTERNDEEESAEARESHDVDEDDQLLPDEDREEEEEEGGEEQEVGEGEEGEPNSTKRSPTYGDVNRRIESARKVAQSLSWNWLGTMLTLMAIFVVRGALEVAMPLYLIEQYSWPPTKISLVLLTLLLPAAVNPMVGRFTSRQGPRWWSTGSFAVCGAAMISLGFVTGQSNSSKALFIVHSAVIGIALAIGINANQVAITVAAQRYAPAQARLREYDAKLGRVLSWLSPGTMLSGVTTGWAAGILIGQGYTSAIDYTEDEGWKIFCCGLGALSLAAALGSLFLWRKW